jgi:hypothetical protein
MITVEEIKRKALNKYHQFLVQSIEHQIYPEKEQIPFFPLVIRSDKGSVSDDFTSRAKDLAALNANSKAVLGRGYALDIKEVHTRVNAKQTTIEKMYFETEEDYLACIAKKNETQRVKNALSVFMQETVLLPDDVYVWAVASIDDLKKEYESGFWNNIILCAAWLQTHPQSNLYIREVPLPVHTKFIENNERIIHRILSSERLVSFEKQHGLRNKPVLIHFRSLSKRNPLRLGNQNISEIVLPLEDFINLPQTGLLSDIQQIIIIENEIVYLTFPEVEHTLCIWGSGYEVAMLVSCTFLNKYELYYFGDLDEHGFDILSLYRSLFPKTKSFCMDATTVAHFDAYRVPGKTLVQEKIPEFLTREECDVFMELRSSPEKSRLEQERIPNLYIEKKLLAVT